MRTSPFLLSIVLLFSPSVFAVNKCKIDGKTVYQDAPCPGGNGGAIRITDNRVQGVDVSKPVTADAGGAQGQGSYSSSLPANRERCASAKRSYDIEMSAIKQASTEKRAKLRAEYEEACGLGQGTIAGREAEANAVKQARRDAAIEQAKIAQKEQEAQIKNNPKISDIQCNLGVCRDKHGNTYNRMADGVEKRSDGKVCRQQFDKLV